MEAGAIDQSIVLKFIDASTGQDETDLSSVWMLATRVELIAGDRLTG